MLVSAVALLALQSLTPAALVDAVPEVRPCEAPRILSHIHRHDHLATPVTNVRRVALDAVRSVGSIPQLEQVSRHASALDPFVKLVLRVPSGELIETVRIPLEKPGRFSVCVSSQVGCALACAFCATGRLGLTRNLEVWEIVEQVRAVRRTLDPARGERVHGVVFQGMGEPMANLDRVLSAIAVLNEPSTQAIDAKNITVCTSGLPSGIRRLAREVPKVRLGLSLGSPFTETRRQLMPIENAHSLAQVLDACVEHSLATGYSPMWALTLLAGVNDSEASAHRVADLFHDFTARAGVRPRLSLIPYNPIGADSDRASGDPFQRSSAEREEAFRAVLIARGVGSHRRYSGGGDVGAACGQLAARA